MLICSFANWLCLANMKNSLSILYSRQTYRHNMIYVLYLFAFRVCCSSYVAGLGSQVTGICHHRRSRGHAQRCPVTRTDSLWVCTFTSRKGATPYRRQANAKNSCGKLCDAKRGGLREKLVYTESETVPSETWPPGDGDRERCLCLYLLLVRSVLPLYPCPRCNATTHAHRIKP